MKFDLASIKEKLDQLQCQPKKSLGQNFLVNENAIEKIIQSLDHLKFESLLEIGPGLGALTEKLALKDKPLTLIELDKKFSMFWREKGYSLIEGDALKVNWSELNLSEPVCLVSNLPYQISSSLVIERSISPFGVQFMILMFQKEVAQRITASHGNKDYGLLSVIAQSFWDINKYMDLGPKDFYPPPQVGSRVLVFQIKKSDILNPKSFLKFVKSAFSQRRKKLINNLSSLFPKEDILKGLSHISHNEDVRPESLSVDEFKSLYNALENIKS